MDSDPVFLHAPEPAHLPFGELVDGVGQERPHLLIREDSQHMLCHEFVLKTVVHKVFRPYPAVQQIFNLFYKAIPQPGVQAGVDSGVPFLPAHKSSYVIWLFWKI